MFGFFWSKDSLVRQLRTEALVKDAEIAALEREKEILEAQVDAMAEVIARDRERVAAETAVYARQRADNLLQNESTR